jgi:hypothetical protein
MFPIFPCVTQFHLHQLYVMVHQKKVLITLDPVYFISSYFMKPANSQVHSEVLTEK